MNIRKESWCREIASSKQDILQYLKGPGTFEELPPHYQQSILRYIGEGFGVGEEKRMMEHLSKYRFLMGDVPTEVLVEEIERVHGKTGEADADFNKYHEEYVGMGPMPDHGPENRWPVTLSEYYEDEVLEDGWHRFHDYYRKGHKTIPVVEWVRKGKKKVASDLLTLYHVTPAAKLRSIKKKGLIPSLGPRSEAMGENKPCLFFFKSKNDVEEALMNWLGDEFDEDEPLALLEVLVEPQAVSEADPNSFEVVVCVPIPPDNIRVLEKDL